jgi:hypothetical protein
MDQKIQRKKIAMFYDWCVGSSLLRTRILPKWIAVLGASLIYFKESKYNWWFAR